MLGGKIECSYVFTEVHRNLGLMVPFSRVPEVGFEPTKHFAAHLECAPFDHSGTPA